jgi:hypothetical protein
MAKRTFREELEQRAARAILTRAIYRWESAVTIALMSGLAVLSLAGVLPPLFPFWRWWFWLLLGAAGEAGLVWSSITDPEFRAQAVAEMFREKFGAREIKEQKLREQVDKALDYRDQIDAVGGCAPRSSEGRQSGHHRLDGECLSVGQAIGRLPG